MPLFTLDDDPNNFTAPGGGTDTILGLGGNDTLNGADQNDSVMGGTGNDSLNGGSQNDTVRGEAGNDTIINPSGGDDLMDGGDDDDSIFGSAANETMLGGSGNDTLVGGGGADSLSGGDGNDWLVGGGFGIETLDGGAGDDVILTGSGPRMIFAGAGNDSISGFTSDSQSKYIDGGGGFDRTTIPSFNPANLTANTSGATVIINGQPYPYSHVYNSGTGFNVYFANYYGEVNGLVICFREGTRIMTAEGERAVETLRAGDMVVTASGRGAPLKPVRWMGRRSVNLDAHPRAEAVAPIMVMPGALGAGMPHRPLCVSPDHALLVDGALVPAKFLVDGEAIRQLPARGNVTYFHVELETHDILLSEGAPTESYMDRGNRDAFENAGAVQMLHADFTPRHLDGGMPIVTEGPALEKARLFLAAHRAAAEEPVRAIA